ncbi:MAG: cation diffusion facilitator family transporter [Nocardioidaceae bacterium]|nr:cation diffusion facilitator family transporter [Nocardioidaceae bacterium]
MSAENSPKAIIAALLANLGIAVTKFVAWLITGSSSMLAETIHSLADSGNQMLLLVGGKRAQRPATETHQFGYGRERYIYAFIVSIVLFSVGGLFALYEAYHKYHELKLEGADSAELLHGNWKWVPIAVLLVAIVLETLSFRTAIMESNKVRGKASWKQFIRNAKAPELPVVLLEDFAALLGLVFALFGVSMALFTNNGYWDVIGTVAIGLLLVTVAIVLAIETKSLLLGESAHEDKRQLIEENLLAAEGNVSEVLNLRTLHVGPDEILVAAKIAVTPTESAHRVAETINAAEVRIRSAVPEAKYIFIEPDIKRPAADFNAEPPSH